MKAGQSELSVASSVCSSPSRTARSAASRADRRPPPRRVRGIAGILRQQPGDEPGEQIAAAALGHAGIAGGVHGDAAIGMRDERARALEHQRDADALRKAARRLEPVGLHFGDGDAGQPRHLAGMRREHQRALAAARQLGQQHGLGGQNVERVGVDHRRHRGGREQAGGELDRLRLCPSPGPMASTVLPAVSAAMRLGRKIFRGRSGPRRRVRAARSSAPAQWRRPRAARARERPP